MPYETLHKFVVKPAKTAAPVIASYICNTKNKLFELSITRAQCNELGWAVGDKIECREGSGSDVGYLKLAKTTDPNGYVLFGWGEGRKKTSKEPLKLRIGIKRFRYNAFPNNKIDGTEVLFDKFANELTIAMPDWVAKAA